MCPQVVVVGIGHTDGQNGIWKGRRMGGVIVCLGDGFVCFLRE